ncbi:MAG: MarR family winged helix-turn-helix transcriptional regulator [Phycicoccus sp.]
MRRHRAMRVHGELVRIVHAISQEGARELRTFGLTPAQYHLLALVEMSAECTQQQVAERLGVTKGNVSMLVSRLEEVGLVARIPDGAAVGLRLTATGRDALERIRPRHARFLAERYSRLDDGQLDDLEEILRRLDPGC